MGDNNSSPNEPLPVFLYDDKLYISSKKNNIDKFYYKFIVKITAFLFYFTISGCAYIDIFNKNDDKESLPAVTQESLENLYKSLNNDRQKVTQILMKQGFICYIRNEKDKSGQYPTRCFRGQCIGRDLDDTQIQMVESQFPSVERISVGGFIYTGDCKNHDIKNYSPRYLDRFIDPDMERLK